MTDQVFLFILGSNRLFRYFPMIKFTFELNITEFSLAQTSGSYRNGEFDATAHYGKNKELLALDNKVDSMGLFDLMDEFTKLMNLEENLGAVSKFEAVKQFLIANIPHRFLVKINFGRVSHLKCCLRYLLRRNHQLAREAAKPSTPPHFFGICDAIEYASELIDSRLLTYSIAKQTKFLKRIASQSFPGISQLSFQKQDHFEKLICLLNN